MRSWCNHELTAHKRNNPMNSRLMSFPLALLALAVLASGAGAQCEIDKLIASDGATADEFGFSVSLSGNTALVGAWQFSSGPGSPPGSAYVFEKQGAVWVETAKLTASDAAAHDLFGVSVSLSGDTALVGAIYDDDAGAKSGSAYVFEKPPGGWMNMTETAKLTASDPAVDDQFGSAVSLSGDTALVGANGNDDVCPLDLFCNSGSAYVFEKQGPVWVQKAKLTASDAAAHDLFGSAVSLSGDTALVGAYHTPSPGIGSADPALA